MRKRTFYLTVCILTLFLHQAGKCQNDTLMDHQPDSVQIQRAREVILQIKDSLTILREDYSQCQDIISNLNYEINALKSQLENLRSTEKELFNNNKNLKQKISELDKEVMLKDKLLQEHIELLKQKEQILREKEQLYKEAMFDSKIDSVELSGKLNSKEVELAAKIKEIHLLEQNIGEKTDLIRKKNQDLNEIKQISKKHENQIENLRDTLSASLLSLTSQKKDLEHTRAELESAKEQIKYVKNQLSKCQNRGKKKKIRLVQGISVVTYRTPNYELAPKDYENTSVYEINNKNAGSLEVDYITGTTVKIFDITDPKSDLTSDFGFFVGIGGKEIFKNLYVGPNVKLFNVLHINTGINIREYEVLKSGFSEGDVLDIGTPIPTNNEWKINFYFGLTFDFDLITQIARKS